MRYEMHKLNVLARDTRNLKCKIRHKCGQSYEEELNVLETSIYTPQGYWLFVVANITPTYILTNTDIPKRGTMLIAQFCIWREHCNRIFTEENKEVTDIKDEVM